MPQLVLMALWEITMTAIEQLASAVAFLGNEQLDQLAQELVQNYAPRAERLETLLSYGLMDQSLQKEVDTHWV